VAEVLPSGTRFEGCLALYHRPPLFELAWFRYRTARRRHLEITEHQSDLAHINDWSNHGAFTIATRDLTTLTFFAEPFSVSLRRFNSAISRNWQLDMCDPFLVAHFIKTILYTGLGGFVPSPPFTIGFFQRAVTHTAFRINSHFDLDRDDLTDFPSFWASLRQEFVRFVVESDKWQPFETFAYPLTDLALVSHREILEQIAQFSSSLPVLSKIDAEDWPGFFDSIAGRMVDPLSFRKRAYLGGIDDSVLGMALPFILGLYPADSSREERAQIDANGVEEFHRLERQIESRLPEQIRCNSKISSYFRVIDHDVDRTDRHHPFFSKDNCIGLAIVRSILRVYVFANPRIGYLQGMNDLVVPIILVYFRSWNDEGVPLNPDGSEMTDWRDFVPKIFWLFDALLTNTGHGQILMKISKDSLSQTQIIFDLFSVISPVAAVWLRTVGLNEFHWLFTDYILMFKRSFPHIWDVWLQINASPLPASWLSYFVTAFLIDTFEEIAGTEDMSMVKMMEEMPRMLVNLDLKKSAVVALWISDRKSVV
jgi:hypothetical protein